MKKILLAVLALMMFGMPVVSSAETNGQDEVTQVPRRQYRRAYRQVPPRYRRNRPPRRAHARPQEYRKGQPAPQHGVYGAPINRGSCVDKVSKKRKK